MSFSPPQAEKNLGSKMTTQGTPPPIREKILLGGGFLSGFTVIDFPRAKPGFLWTVPNHQGYSLESLSPDTKLTLSWRFLLFTGLSEAGKRCRTSSGNPSTTQTCMAHQSKVDISTW